MIMQTATGESRQYPFTEQGFSMLERDLAELWSAVFAVGAPGGHSHDLDDLLSLPDHLHNGILGDGGILPDYARLADDETITGEWSHDNFLNILDGWDIQFKGSGAIGFGIGTGDDFFLGAFGSKELLLDLGVPLFVDTLRPAVGGSQLNMIGPVVGTGDFTWDSPTFHVDAALDRVGLFATNPAFDFDIRKATGSVTQRLRGTSSAQLRMESSTFGRIWALHLNGSPDTLNILEDGSFAKTRMRFNPGGIVDIPVSLAVDFIGSLDEIPVAFTSPLNLQFDAGAGGSETEIIGYDFDGGVG